MIIDSGIVTGSLQVSGSFSVQGNTTLNGGLNVIGGITGSISGSATTASYALTASYAPDYLPLAGGTVTGNLVVAGTASIAYLNVTFESASIIYSSGSNIFGDAVNDTQTLYGTVIIPTGSLIVSGTTAVDGDLTVSPDGYEVFHVHTSGVDVTGSLTVDSDLTINANMYMLADKVIYGTASYANSTVQAPYYTLTSSFNTTSGSLSTRVTNLESWSSSLDATYATDAQLNAATASLQAGVTASINSLSSSVAPQIVTLTSASASFASQLSSVSTGSFTGSFAGYFAGDGSGLTNVPASGIVGLNLSRIASGSATASIAPDKGFTVNTNAQITGSLQVTAGITGSFSGSLYNLQNSIVNHIPYFSQSQILADSAIIQVDNGLDQGYSIAINQNGVNAENPEALFVYQASTSSFNVISGKGNLNNYLQLNIQNSNNGLNASSDVVATANNGNESVNFIDMGINGANFSGPIGGANDAYVYSTGNNLHIGNASTGSQHLGFFVGGDDVDTNNKLTLNPGNLHNLTGSLNASNGFIGSLTGNADTATTASNALTASSADSFLVRNNATVTNTLTAQTLVVQTVTSSIVYSSGSNIFGNQLSNTQQLTGSVSITGSLNVNGSNAILTNQTSSMTVLSASYASTASFALNVNPNATASYAINALSASYAETAPAYLTTASYNQDSASFSTRDTNLEATASSLVNASASFSTRTTTLESASASFAVQSGSNSTRLTNLESTASTLTTASASFATVSSSYAASSASLSTRTSNLEVTSSNLTTASASFSIRVTNTESTASTLVTASGSTSIRVTNLETTASNLVTASGSFSTRTTDLESTASILTTASASFATVSASFSSTSGSLSTRTINLEATASTLTTASASFATQLNGIAATTGSYATTSSNTFTGTQYISNTSNAISFTSTASLYTDGGLRVTKDAFVSGALTVGGNFTVFGTASINYVTTSVFVGLEYINLNTELPALRYAGINVGDSGSGVGLSSSYWYDSEKDNWLYVYTPAGSAQQTSSIAINGPIAYNNLGNEQGLLGNYVVKSQLITAENNHHVTSSQIFDDGTTVSIAGNLTVTGSITGTFNGVVSGTASWANNAVNAPFYTLTSSFDAFSGSIVGRTTNLESTASTLTTASASFALVSASFSSTSGSLSTRTTNLESTSSQLITASGSLSIRTTNLETTASTLTTASASFSTRVTNTEATASALTIASASFSIRTTDLEATASTLTTASASFANQLNSISGVSGSYATTGSNQFSGSQSISGSLAVSQSVIAPIINSPLLQNGSQYIAQDTNTQITAIQNGSQTWGFYPGGQFYPAGPIVGSSYGSNELILTDIASAKLKGTLYGAQIIVSSDQSGKYVWSFDAVTGNLTAPTASSFLGTASVAISSSYALTASYAANVPVTASYALTASYVLNAESASFATTASFATNFTASNILVNGTVTAQTLNVQQVTSSIVYSSGSNTFGNLLTDTQQLTGSVTITGSLLVNGRTPLFTDQTASLTVTSASYAATASYANSTATVPFNVGGTSTYYGTVNSSNVGSNNVFTLSTGSYTAGFFKYTVYNGSNARSGEVMAVWNQDTATFTDVSTLDLGNTAAVSTSVSIVSSQMQFNFQTSTSGWTIRSQGILI